MSNEIKTEQELNRIITDSVKNINRPDLFRKPLVSFSSVKDKRYQQLKEIIGPWHAVPKELLSTAESVISYFVPFTKEVAIHPNCSDKASVLWAEAYQEINRYFVRINDAVCSFLTERGYDAYSVPPTHTYSQTDLKCTWSHRSAAVIAGLGSFGANRLVITAKGSGGRFCSVITSAVLEPCLTPFPQKCLYYTGATCSRCFDACPVGALCPDSFLKFTCQDKLNQNEIELLQGNTASGAYTARVDLNSADICGKCISACPFCYIP